MEGVPYPADGLFFTKGIDTGPDRIIYKITGTNPMNGLLDNFASYEVITHTLALRVTVSSYALMHKADLFPEMKNLIQLLCSLWET